MTKKENAEQNENTDLKTDRDMFDGIDLDELFKTTKLAILPEYNAIPENDLTTIRKVKVVSLPKSKFIEKDKKGNEVNKQLLYMVISENGMKYSLPANSIALRRSLFAIGIELSKAKEMKDVDLSKVVDKLLIIKRREFINNEGYKSAPLQFFQID